MPFVEISVNFNGKPGIPRYDEIIARAADLSPASPRVFQAMRFAPGGGVATQYASQAEISMGGLLPWPKTHAFGTRPAPLRTLHESGALESGWLGGAGSISRATPNSFAIGVSAAAFPQARVFQAQGPTVIRPRKMGKRGRSAMAWRLGMLFGVWLSEERLRQGLVIQPRRVSINREMLRAVRAEIRSYLLGKQQALARAA